MTVTPQPIFGVPQYLYVLGDRGAELLASLDGRQVTPFRQCGFRLSTLTHHHLVNECFVTFHEATVDGRYTLANWLPEWKLKFRDKRGRVRGERVTVRDPKRANAEAVTMLPDALFDLVVAGQRWPFFFELDLSTHPLRRWRQRGLAFAAYAERKLFARRFGTDRQSHFKLLVVTPPDAQQRRCATILRTIEAVVAANPLFLVTSLDVFQAAGRDLLTQPIWHRARGNHPVAMTAHLPRTPIVRVRVSPSSARPAPVAPHRTRRSSHHE